MIKLTVKVAITNNQTNEFEFEGEGEGSTLEQARIALKEELQRQILSAENNATRLRTALEKI